MKLTVRRLRGLIKEEYSGAKTYRKLGLYSLANVENRHARILKRRLAVMTKKVAVRR